MEERKISEDVDSKVIFFDYYDVEERDKVSFAVDSGGGRVLGREVVCIWIALSFLEFLVYGGCLGRRDGLGSSCVW